MSDSLRALGVDLGDGTGEVESHGDFSADGDFRGQKERVGESLLQFNVQFDRVARYDGLLEANVIQSRGDRNPATAFNELTQQNGPGLHARLAQEHSGRQWKLRVVTGVPELVAAEGLSADDVRVVLLDDLIDQQEGGTMGDCRFDGCRRIRGGHRASSVDGRWVETRQILRCHT